MEKIGNNLVNDLKLSESNSATTTNDNIYQSDFNTNAGNYTDDKIDVEKVYNNNSHDGYHDDEDGDHGDEDDDEDDADKFKDCQSGDNQDRINEIYLKKMEENLSDDEKKERREESSRMKEAGNEHFKSCDYLAAIEVYSQALSKCPYCFPADRSVLYSNRAAAKLKLNQLDFALEDCNKSLEANELFIKARLRRADIYEKLEKLEDALEDYKKILEQDPSIHIARAATMRLPEQINEQREKMKTEMFGKLKDLGNLILNPFGLSTENFKVEKNEQTGSYSINFQQNK